MAGTPWRQLWSQATSRDSGRMRIGIGLTTVLALVGVAALNPEVAIAQNRPPGYPVRGVDSAVYQHPKGAAINWRVVRGGGWSFVVLKASEGTGYTNPWFGRDIAGARSAGLAVMPYHFWNHRGGVTPVQQADHFVSRLRGVGYTGHRPGDLPPLLDLEGCATRTTVSAVNAFLTRVQDAFGRTPFVYSSRGSYGGCLSGAGLGTYPLDVADYVHSRPALPSGWSSWLIWQYAGAATVAGMSAAAPVEVFNGPRSRLDVLANRCSPRCPI